MVTEKIAEHFESNTLWGGLTYSAHPLSCAVGVANIEVFHQENLIEKSREMGKVLRAGLVDLAEKLWQAGNNKQAHALLDQADLLAHKIPEPDLQQQTVEKVRTLENKVPDPE